MIKFRYSLILMTLVTCLVSGCATAPKAGKPTASVQDYASEEVKIGEQIHAQILSQFYPYTEPEVVAYINHIGASLAAFAKRKDLPYRFTLLFNEKIYATSAPGGFIYLTTGLVNFLDNESELAAVLAHEIGELQYADPRLSRSYKVLEALQKAAPAVGALGEIGVLAVVGLAMASSLVESRQLSAEERLLSADERALHYMVEAGQDPQGLIDVMSKFLHANQQVAPYFFDYYQSRPITEERMQMIQAVFLHLPLANKTFSTNRNTYRQMTRGIREMYQA
ncbi:MAG: M48 family metalloprotease [Candidatus Omnitrophica bacterium]|nr:M48 family metalloprotease [Candidatus Omnitrophota bacterium]